MYLGLGLYKSILNDSNFRFAKQAGATHIVAQLVDYIKGDDQPTLTKDYLNGWGRTYASMEPWGLDQLIALRKQVESHGLTLGAIENFDPGHWYDVLLDGPKKREQIENLKTIIRNVGRAGIPIIGYYFSLAGVWGWTVRQYGRGLPETVGFDQSAIETDRPIPKGMVWNMMYEDLIPDEYLAPVSYEEMWERLTYFLSELLPVAEESGVRLVAHPDDPPVPRLRQTDRLFYSQERYERLLSAFPSPANGLECCLGTLQEMASGNVYDFVRRHAECGNIGYIHFRNVSGKVPNYREVFVDEGDLNMINVLKILKQANYQGIIIPDHTPAMTAPGAWHTGMAHALGYMKGVLQCLEAV
jgi:mannonate dehydratase